MTGTSTLRDYFSTDSLATNWPATTGMVSVANGVASIQCGTTTGNALKTNPIYTVKNDKVDFKIAALPSAFGLPGLSSTVTMTFAVTLSPPQTLAIEIDMVTSQLYCLNGTASALAPRGYDPSWTRVRIREGTAPSGNVPVGTAGNTYFDVSTADDESHWINLGSIRSPTWVATATTLAIVVSCHRNGGTVDVGQVDNVNCRAADPPTGVTVTPGDGELTVSWTAPANTGGAPITGYLIDSGGPDPTVVSDPSATSASVGGLVNGTSYSITVATVTDVGTGVGSEAVIGTPVMGPPNAPTGVLATPGDSSARIDWNVPAGDELNTYTITLDDGAGGVLTRIIPAPLTTALVDGLVNDTTYTVTVIATNPAGDSPPSASTTVTPAFGASRLVEPSPMDPALLPPAPVPAPEMDPASMSFLIPGVRQAARIVDGPLQNKAGHVQGMWLEKLDNGQILYLLPSRGGLWLTGFDPGYPVIQEVTQGWPDRDGVQDYTDRYGPQNLVVNLLAEPWRGIDINGVRQSAAAWAALARIWSSLDNPVRLHYQLTGQPPVYCDVRTNNFSAPISGEELGRYTIPVTWGFYNADGMTYGEVADSDDEDPARPGWYIIRIRAKAVGTAGLNFGGGSTWTGGAGLVFDGGSVDAPSAGINFGGESSFGSPIIAVPRTSLGSRRTAPIITISGGACTGPIVSVYGATDRLTLRARLQFSSALVLSADDMMLIDVPNRRVVRNPDRYGNGEPLYRYLTGAVDWRNFTINPSEGNGFAFDALASSPGATASFSYRAASV
jgi:hypothetical protein